MFLIEIRSAIGTPSNHTSFVRVGFNPPTLLAWPSLVRAAPVHHGLHCPGWARSSSEAGWCLKFPKVGPNAHPKAIALASSCPFEKLLGVVGCKHRLAHVDKPRLAHENVRHLACERDALSFPIISFFLVVLGLWLLYMSWCHTPDLHSHTYGAFTFWYLRMAPIRLQLKNLWASGQKRPPGVTMFSAVGRQELLVTDVFRRQRTAEDQLPNPRIVSMCFSYLLQCCSNMGHSHKIETNLVEAATSPKSLYKTMTLPASEPLLTRIIHYNPCLTSINCPRPWHNASIIEASTNYFTIV